MALDHVRALAAFMVVVWHFTHAATGFPVPFEFVPAILPFALLDEGHTGVALFMTLSGYLFAKLLDGKRIRYSAFFWNRALRLLPLLVVVIVVAGLRLKLAGEPMAPFYNDVLKGWLHPSLPNGGWSITVEVHYYLLLPLLLAMFRLSVSMPLIVVGLALAARAVIYLQTGEVQSLAYWTLLGRIDQFVLGMFAFQCRGMITGRGFWALGASIVFSGFYWCFNQMGGFYRNDPYTPASAVWIVMPLLEAAFYAMMIAWYETSFNPGSGVLSRLVAKIGELSYSIYLLHFFLVFAAARVVHRYLLDLSNFYVATGAAFVFFLGMVPIAAISYRYLESPFLRLRRHYVIGP